MAILYILVLVVFTYKEVKNILKDGYISLFSMFYFTIAFLYLLSPAIMFITVPNYEVWSIKTINQSTNRDRVVALLIVIMVLVILRLAKKTRIKRIPVRNYEDGTNFCMEEVRTAIRNVCMPWFVILLGLGGLGFALMVSQIGISGFITFSGHSRGVTATIGTSGSILGYAQFLSKFLIASLTPGILLYQTKKNRLFSFFLFVLVICSLLIEIFIAGKSNFIIFVIPFVMLLLSDRRGRMKKSALILVTIAVLVAVFLLDNLFYYLQYGVSVSVYRTAWETHDYINRYLREFAYAYANLLNSRSIISQMGYRFFIDYPGIIVNLLPAFLLGGLQIKPAYTLVDSYYGLVGMDSLSPADYMIFGMLQLDIWGLAIISFIRGSLFKGIDNMITRLRRIFNNNNINGTHIFTCCSCFAIVSVLSEPFTAIRSQPILLCSIVICISIYKKLMHYKNGER